MYKRKNRNALSPRALAGIRRSAEAARKLHGNELLRVRKRVDTYLRRHRSDSSYDALAGELERYALGGKLLGSVLGKFGALGKAIEAVLGGVKRPGVSQQSIQDAVDLLKVVAPHVLTPEARGIVEDPLPTKPTKKPRRSGRRAPTSEPVSPATPTPTEEELPLGRFPHDVGIPMYRVQGSSNVYAYGYDPHARILRVQFLASALNAGAIRGHEPMRGAIKKPPRGRLGATVTQIRRGPGPVYDYFNVPPLVFQRFHQAASKGGAVWDLLRIRGTIEGHQYEYALSAASLHDVVDESQRVVGKMTYVPRRAVRGGFQERVSLQGAAGGRTFRSMLPSTTGPRRFGPNDGTRGLRG